jgi:hypothetical protein
MTTRSRSMSSGHGLRTGRLRVKARTLCAFAAAACAASSSSLAGDFKFQFQLLDQPRRALGTRPVQFAFELLDPAQPAPHTIPAQRPPQRSAPFILAPMPPAFRPRQNRKSDPSIALKLALKHVLMSAQSASQNKAAFIVGVLLSFHDVNT